ncbi:MAG: hypothetical protein AAF950_05375 [Pseudomonadota bacterium]
MERVIDFIIRFMPQAITLISALVALISAILARRARKRQEDLIFERLRHDVDRTSLEWGREAVNTLSEAEHLLRHPDLATTAERRRDLLPTLSALIDRGRMYFPNLDPEGKGIHKEGAFRGYRPPVLDGLVYAYCELVEIDDPRPESADFLCRCRRLVVSELQAHIDPHTRDEVVERYDTRRDKYRDDAQNVAASLKQELSARRSGAQFESNDEDDAR